MNFKNTISIISFSAVLLLAGCDNNEKTPAKNENAAPTVASVTETASQQPEETSKQEAKTQAEQTSLTANKTEQQSEAPQVENKSIKAALATPVEAVEKNAEATKEQKAASSTTSALSNKSQSKTKKRSAYYQQQLALLTEVEKQYEQIRCTEDYAKLGEYSFCRQEERRLFLEMQRLRDDLRVNE